MDKKKTSKLIAVAAAGMFLTGTGLAVTATPANAAAHLGKCKVKNSCKGKGACGVKGKHDCAGKNACKGQGWVYIKADGKKVMMTEEECNAIQGATFKSKKKKEEKKS